MNHQRHGPSRKQELTMKDVQKPEESKILRKSIRVTAGINKSLDGNFNWEKSFGRSHVDPVASQEDEMKLAVTEDIGDKLCSEAEKTGTESLREPSINEKMVLVPGGFDVYCKSRITKVSSISKVSSTSKVSSMLLKKRLEFEAEKKKMALLQEKMEIERRLKLLEMEKDLKIAEIQSDRTEYITTENISLESVSGEDKVKKWFENYQEVGSSPNKIMGDAKPNEDDKLAKLCETVADAIKVVSSADNRQTVPDREFPYFDGRSEEWPFFISQVHNIINKCNYNENDIMLRFQRCLKGEAREAVRSMMLYSENTNLILRTLQLRLGRIEQVIDTLVNKIQVIPVIREYDFEGFIKFSCTVNNLVSTMEQLEATSLFWETKH